MIPLTPINFVRDLQDPTNENLLRHSIFHFVIIDENTVVHTDILKLHLADLHIIILLIKIFL